MGGPVSIRVELMLPLLGVDVWEEVEGVPVVRQADGRYRLQLRMAEHVTATRAKAFAASAQLRLDGALAASVDFLGYLQYPEMGANLLILEVLVPAPAMVREA